MRRRGAQSDRGRVSCTACKRQLPHSAFSKGELSQSGHGVCRDCAHFTQCDGCNEFFAPALLDDTGRCRQCRENEQVDRLLQTPKDEVTHFGASRAISLQHDLEYTLLLVCYRYRVWERPVLQRIVDLLRIPFVTSHNGVNYCELCDEAFGEIAICQGQKLRMEQDSKKADWSGCPGPALKFATGEKHTVAELKRVANGSWFFRTQAKTRPKPVPAAWRELHVTAMMDEIQDDLREIVVSFLQEQSLASAGPLATVSRQYLSQCFEYAGAEFTDDHRDAVISLVERAQMMAVHAASTSPLPSFLSLWAPVSASTEGQRPSPLATHLQSTTHTSIEADIKSGRRLLVSRAAMELAKSLGEQPTSSLSRFHCGLGLKSRFCVPADLERARQLQRVRDSNVPSKLFKEVLRGRREDNQWVSLDELAIVEEEYARRKGSKGR